MTTAWSERVSAGVVDRAQAKYGAYAEGYYGHTKEELERELSRLTRDLATGYYLEIGGDRADYLRAIGAVYVLLGELEHE